MQILTRPDLISLKLYKYVVKISKLDVDFPDKLFTLRIDIKY